MSLLHFSSCLGLTVSFHALKEIYFGADFLPPPAVCVCVILCKSENLSGASVSVIYNTMTEWLYHGWNLATWQCPSHNGFKWQTQWQCCYSIVCPRDSILWWHECVQRAWVIFLVDRKQGHGFMPLIEANRREDKGTRREERWCVRVGKYVSITSYITPFMQLYYSTLFQLADEERDT